MTLEEKEKRKQIIIEKYMNGARVCDLAKEYGLHVNTIGSYVKPHREERKAQRVRQVREKYLKNPSLLAVAQELGLTTGFVSKALDDNTIRKARADLIRRQFLGKIQETNDCWVWTGRLSGRGYGAFRSTSAHRAAYQMFVGPIPQGLQVHHECGVTFCVNPDHLRLATHKENVSIQNGKFSFRGHKWEPFETNIEYINQHQNLHREHARQLRDEMLKKVA